VVAFKNKFCKGPDQCLQDTQWFIAGFGEGMLSQDNPLILARECARQKMAQIVEKTEE
jgi:hypothetical protein